MSLPFNGSQSWKQKTLDADKIWSQVKSILKLNDIELPVTPRRPDVRIIVNNISGNNQLFRNPGNHSDKAENIPAKGDSTAAMIMVKGDDLAEQFKNAKEIVRRYNLGKEGLSAKFVKALSGDALDLIDEAYGPAPFKGQADKLVQVNWNKADGTTDKIKPSKTKACAYGAREASNETAFITKLAFAVKGSGTVPENISGGIAIAVSEDWETKKESTRPIDLKVAKDFYGEHFDNMPSVTVTFDGTVTEIDLADGRKISLSCSYEMQDPSLKLA
jgi:hypothetical protein